MYNSKTKSTLYVQQQSKKCIICTIVKQKVHYMYNSKTKSALYVKQ